MPQRLKSKQQRELLNKEECSRLLAMTLFEEAGYKAGRTKIAGVDEAGRGPLAGPVVAAACILPRGYLIEGLDDSKKLTPLQRSHLYKKISEDPKIIHGIGVVSHEEIDRINILQATIVAMLKAVSQLKEKPDYILCDGLKLPHDAIPTEKIIKGDSLSLSIAAASILAKVTRDRLMLEYHEKFPEYGFDKHKGYGTEKHRAAIARLGPCAIHRKTFEPIKSL